MLADQSAGGGWCCQPGEGSWRPQRFPWPVTAFMQVELGGCSWHGAKADPAAKREVSKIFL